MSEKFYSVISDGIAAFLVTSCIFSLTSGQEPIPHVVILVLTILGVVYKYYKKENNHGRP